MTETGRIPATPHRARGGIKVRHAMQRKSELKVEFWPLDAVKPYEKNPRIVPQSAVEKLATSIKLYGWRQPIVVDKNGVIIAGHTRRLAAMHLGLAEVPVHVAKDMSEAEARAYRLADNRVADETRWDMNVLAEELKGLAAIDMNLIDLGFDPIELPTDPPVPSEITSDDVLPLDEVSARVCPHCGGQLP